jgi:hypothetical protein
MPCRLLFATLLLIPTVTFSATIYIDGGLASNYTNGTYSIVNRTCDSGSDGNAYTTIAAALDASAADDTIRFRPGSYATPTGGLFPRTGQTWESCRVFPCGSTEMATITAEGERHIIAFDNHNIPGSGDNVTFRNLTLSGGTHSALVAATVQNFTVDGLDISGVQYLQQQ